MTNSGTGNRQQGTKNYSMTAWLGTRVCFIDLTWSKRPGRRPLQFSKPGTIIRPLIFQIMLRASGDRKQPCALSDAISINGFPRTGCSGIGERQKVGVSRLALWLLRLWLRLPFGICSIHALYLVRSPSSSLSSESAQRTQSREERSRLRRQRSLTQSVPPPRLVSTSRGPRLSHAAADLCTRSLDPTSNAPSGRVDAARTDPSARSAHDASEPETR